MRSGFLTAVNQSTPVNEVDTTPSCGRALRHELEATLALIEQAARKRDLSAVLRHTITLNRISRQLWIAG